VWDNCGSINKVISLINENGELLKSYDANFEKGFFGDNQFISFSNKYLLSINTENLEINFHNKPANDELYLDVTLSKESIIAITAKPPKLNNGKWFYKDPTILEINLNGKIVKQINAETPLFSNFDFRRTGAVLKFVAGDKTIVVE